MSILEDLNLKFISNDIIKEVKELLSDISQDKDRIKIKNSYYALMEELTGLYNKSINNAFRDFVASSVISQEDLEKTLAKEQVIQKEIFDLVYFLQTKIYSLVLK